jgi:DNA-binding winged helix-turn-helix (wHTH) protein
MVSRRALTGIIACVALALSLPAALLFSFSMAQEREREFLRQSEWMARNFADQVWLQLRTLASEDPSQLRAVFSTMVEEFVVMDPVVYAQIVLHGELIAQHHHLGDLPTERVLALGEGAVPARRTERKHMGSLEYLDIWRAIEPGSVRATSYVRLGVSLAPLRDATAAMYRLALLWAMGFVVVISALAYLSWPWWAKREQMPPSPLTPLPQEGEEPGVTRGAEGELSFGQLVIDDHAKEVRLNEATLPLTPREYALIRLLASEPGRVFSAQEIIARAWGTEKFISSEDVKKYIYLLRQKLEYDPQNPKVILTVRGFGYKFVPPRSSV